MEYFLVIFLHVAFGMVWVGGAVAAGFFFIPAVLEAGPAGGAVMAGVMKRKFPVVMTASAVTVVLTGIRLYMVRFSTEWLATAEGIVLTLGAVLGLGGFFLGLLVQKPTAERMGALGAQIAASGGPPSPEQARELEALRAKLSRVARLTGWHLIGAATLMASHRLATLF